MLGEFLEFLGIPCGFPLFDFQPLKTGHSLHLGTERYVTKPDGATLVPWDLHWSHFALFLKAGLSNH